MSNEKSSSVIETTLLEINHTNDLGILTPCAMFLSTETRYLTFSERFTHRPEDLFKITTRRIVHA